MNRAQSRRSEVSETQEHYEHGIANEMELAKLHRQTRIMEGDRKAYSEESQNTIRKQRATIDKLERDNEYLTGELQMKQEARSEEMNKSSTDTKKMEEMKQQVVQYQQRIKVEQERQEELEREIKEVNKYISDRRSKMGGVNAASQNNIAVQKQIRILENRLDKALVKFNQSLACNKQLRETIDNLRRERVVFDNIYRKLEKELGEIKKSMGEIIESSNMAYEARDEAQAKMIALKEKADKELTTYSMELKELTRILEHDRKLKTFMGVKGQDRSKEDEDQWGKTSKTKKTCVGKTGFEANKDKTESSQETVQSYEEAFAKIREQTEIEDIDKLVEKFIEVEDQNFSHFNYVNELNNEIEKLLEQITEIKGDIEKFKGQGVNMDNQRKKILKDLEEKLNTTHQQSSNYEDCYSSALKILNQLKVGINSIFERIECDKTAITDMLGNSGVSETNMMQYLGIIEQRTNEILQRYNSRNVKTSPDKEIHVVTGGLLGQGPQAPVGAVTIQPPSTGGDDYDSDDDEYSGDDEQRPMTRNDLKQKILRGISKRETMGRKADQVKKKGASKRNKNKGSSNR